MYAYIGAIAGTSLGQFVGLPDGQITENTLLLADLTFGRPPSGDGAPDGSDWSASALEDFEGPKLTEIMPGIAVSRLPGVHASDR